MKLTPPLEREIDSAMRSIPFAPPDEIAKPASTAFSTNFWANFWAPLSEVSSLGPTTATALMRFIRDSSPT